MESTQERITRAARKLFGENGFHGTTTAEIAREAGIAEGTIYRYYRDKKELLVACVEPVIQEAVRRETAIMLTEPPQQILQRRIVERIRVIRENMDVFNILFTEGQHHPEIARILLDQVKATVPAEQWEAIGRAAEIGILRQPVNPLIMSVGVTAAIWAMLCVGPAADQLFAGWPGPFRYANMENDLAEFVCAALVGNGENGGTHDA